MNEVMGRSGAGNMVAVVESANIAEIQGKMILARNFPRDIERCISNILKECKSKELAEKATYEFPKGDTVVKGPSIRLVECVARHWGNVVSGIQEISSSDKGATVKAFCWDLESNFSDEKIFDIEYKRTTKKGTYALTDPRDKYEMLANLAARRKRACMQAIIPQYVIDEAVEACQATLEDAIRRESGNVGIEEVKEKMLSAFKAIADWITPEDLGEKCGKPFDSLNEKDIVKLRNLFNAIKDGFIKPEAAFGKEEAQKPDTSEKDDEALAEVNGLFEGANNTLEES